MHDLYQDVNILQFIKYYFVKQLLGGTEQSYDTGVR